MRIPTPAATQFVLAALAVSTAWPIPSAAQVTRNMQVLSHFDDYHVPVVGEPWAYSACWSYIHPDGREYAVIGTSGGAAIYNVSNPSAAYRVAFIPGPPSIWREIKQYRYWIYIVTEGHGPGQGLQIVRMTDPENPVLAATYTSPNFVSAHTVTVDTTRAILVTNGSKSDAGGGAFPFTGMRLFSLANPEAPLEIAAWPPGGPYDDVNYVHDSVIVGNRLYAARIYSELETVFDLSNPSNPIPINTWTYPGAYYTHNSWPDSTGQYLYVTNEHNGQTLRIFDIHDLLNPVLINGISANPVAIVHNAHVLGHELYLANYTEGLRALDLTDPAHPAEFGWADSYPGDSGGYGGVWEVCAFFPSGIVIASDMETGLYVYRPVRNYGLLTVRVQDDQGQPLPDVRVRLTTQGDSLVTPVDGVVRFAPSPGNHTVTVDRFDYGKSNASVSVTAGAIKSVTLTLRLLPETSFGGTLRDRSTQAALDGGEVDLLYTDLEAFTDSTGHYQADGVPDDDYRVVAHRPGYIPMSLDRHIGIATTDEDFRLMPSKTWDPLETGTGWTIGNTGDDAVAGQWVLVAPVGTGVPSAASAAAQGPASPAALASGTATSPISSWLATSSACGDPRVASAGAGCPANATAAGSSGVAVASTSGEEPPSGHCGCGATCLCGLVAMGTASGQVKPGADRSPGTGTRCFVTGQAIAGTGGPDDYDLDGGHTTLTSPTYDMRGMSDPVIGWWRWFYSRYAGTGQPDGNDWLAVLISNNSGQTWVPVDTTRGMHNAWDEQAIHVAKFVNPTSHVRVRFIANDGGSESTVEAGIDDITTYDAALAATDVLPGGASSELRFEPPSPNPFSTDVSVDLELPRPGRVSVDVLDIVGRRIAVLRSGPATAGRMRLTWNGKDARGARVPAGVYFVEARLGDVATRTRLIRTP